MYTKSKYIIGLIRGQWDDTKCALVFAETLKHTDVYGVFIEGSITSAGFCHYEENQVKVYGESIGLKVSSKPEDEVLVGRSMSHPKYIV